MSNIYGGQAVTHGERIATVLGRIDKETVCVQYEDTKESANVPDAELESGWIWGIGLSTSVDN